MSSLAGESVLDVNLNTTGVVGDRQYALIDRATGLPAAPEKDVRWRPAIYLRAESIDGGLPEISFPDGRSYALSHPALESVLSDHFGFPAAIAANPHSENLAEFHVTRYRHPHFPLHLLTTSSLKHLAVLRKVETIDRRRFRPTILVAATSGEGFIENEWIGQRFQLGSINLTVQSHTKRCGMTFISQPGLEEDPEILRSVSRHNKRNLGVYCSVDSVGKIQVGDNLFLSETNLAN